ncbi:PQQ-binding-like beta-propeller repeat protein [Paraconexibacter sp. AEG42_29]
MPAPGPVTPVAARSPPPSEPPPASYAPWPAAGHDARHSGSAPVVGPQRGRVKWRRRLEGPVVPGPIVGRDGTVFAASGGGVLHALDPASGQDRWRFDGGGAYGSDLSTSPLLLPDGRLLLWPGPGDSLYAIDARTGQALWRIAFGGMVLSPALGPDGTVYVADMAGGLRALRPTAGGAHERWRIGIGGTGYASPAVDRRGGVTTVYVAADESLVAVRDERSRGRVSWRRATGALIEVSASVAVSGTVTIGSNDKRQHAFTPSGRKLWEAPLASLTYSSSASAVDGSVLVGDHRGAVSRLAGADGHVLARYVGIPQTPRQRSVGVWTAPATDARGNVYFGTRVGHIYGFAYSGRRLFDVKTGATVDSNPALGPDGTLYVGSEDGYLYAIG